jgi:signal transduction histidine kinase
MNVPRIQEGRLDLELGDVDLAATVRDVVAQFRPELEQAGCAVSLEAERPVLGIWDASRLEMVVGNLLSNALRYGAGKPIRIAVQADGDTAYLAVADHGIGIPREMQARIFERFERAVPARHYGGLGIGLFIVRRVLEALGGRVRVDSEPGRGSTFTVELPRSGPPAAATDPLAS